jgi:hypothetical protein
MKILIQRRNELRWTIERWLNNLKELFRFQGAKEIDHKPPALMSAEASRIAQQLSYQIKVNEDKREV